MRRDGDWPSYWNDIVKCIGMFTFPYVVLLRLRATLNDALSLMVNPGL